MRDKLKLASTYVCIIQHLCVHACYIRYWEFHLGVALLALECIVECMLNALTLSSYKENIK